MQSNPIQSNICCPALLAVSCRTWYWSIIPPVFQFCVCISNAKSGGMKHLSKANLAKRQFYNIRTPSLASSLTNVSNAKRPSPAANLSSAGLQAQARNKQPCLPRYNTTVQLQLYYTYSTTTANKQSIDQSINRTIYFTSCLLAALYTLSVDSYFV